jgi:hypothetical protein
MRIALTAALLALCATLAQAEPATESKPRIPETVNIGVSSREIAIAPDFSGTDVTVFGAIDNPDPYLLAIGAYDIVVSSGSTAAASPSNRCRNPIPWPPPRCLTRSPPRRS